MKRVSAVLCAFLVFSLLLVFVPPLSASAAVPLEIAHGTCGSVSWSLRGDGSMHLSGTGRSEDYYSAAKVPWNSYKNQITSVVVEDGVTGLGSYSFMSCNKITKVELAPSVKTIGSWCFAYCTALGSINIHENITALGNDSFMNCTSLKSLYIPSPKTTIAQEALGIYVNDKIHRAELMPDFALYYPSGASNAPSYLNRTGSNFGGTMTGHTLDVTVDEKGSKYTGKAVKPAVTVLIDGKAVSTSARTVSYEYNIGPGTAYAYIQFTNSALPKNVSTSFRIGYLIEECDITVTPDTFKCFDLQPSATVYSGGTKLKIGQDYVVVTELKGSKLTRSSDTTGSSLTNIGTATVSVEGRGDYISRKTFTVEVQKYDLEKLAMYSKLKPSPTGGYSSSPMNLGNMYYTGEPLTQEFDLRTSSGGYYIDEPACRITYENNVKPGTATMTVTPGDDERLTGKYVRTFKILRPEHDVVTRISGSSRTATAAGISQKSFDKADTVVIASGDSYADALAGVPLAVALRAPILLVQKASGPDAATLAEIKRLGAKKAVILGGSGAVTEASAEKLRAAGCTVDRIAGSTRFETAAQIADRLEKVTGKAPSEGFFVCARNFPDALAVSGVAAAKGAPILYLDTDGVPSAATNAWLTAHKGSAELFIIGGKAAIGGSAEACLDPADRSGKAERISGSSRYDTCVEINERFSDCFAGEYLCTATGTNFPDALAGGVFCALNRAPLLLVGANVSDVRTAYVKKYDPYQIFVFGGAGAVSDKVADAVGSAS